MSDIPELAEAMQTILGETADTLAKETDFIKRERAFKGSSYAQTLVFGWIANPKSTIVELQQTAVAFGVNVTAQAVDKKFTKAASVFMHQLLQNALENLITAKSPVAIPIFERFHGVYLDDSSVIGLPKELLSEWEGCGGSHGPSSALKIQFSYDLKYGSIRALCIRDGKEQDKSSPTQKPDLPKKALRIHDKGLSSLTVMETYNKKDIFWLCPLAIHINVYDTKQKNLDLVSFLSCQSGDEVDIPVYLGHIKVRCRLLAQRVPKEVAAERRRRIRYVAKRKKQRPNKRALQLASWTILITNVPKDLLSVDEAMILYRVRWQIELIFKLWKSYYLIDEWRTERQWRILCEIYAKLIGVLIQHWIFLVTCWQYADKSLMKAAITIQKYAFFIASVFNSFERLCEVLGIIEKLLFSGCRIQKRKKKPMFQLLLDLNGP
jgi:hypothetical protein